VLHTAAKARYPAVWLLPDGSDLKKIFHQPIDLYGHGVPPFF
jgi:hypothetical protein